MNTITKYCRNHYICRGLVMFCAAKSSVSQLIGSTWAFAQQANVAACRFRSPDIAIYAAS